MTRRPPCSRPGDLQVLRARVRSTGGSDPALAGRVQGELEAGLRGVLQTGLRGPVSDDVLAIGDVPHDWLFPQLAAVAHHCGAGTTASGVRAGVPTVAVPVMNDQPFWASRLTALGVAPAAIPFRRLTPARLAAALTTAATDPAYRQRAQALSAHVSAEDGAAPVVEAVNELAHRPH
ncbi:nucleotide disphospho-sugar-binding domain-containing protein [Nonomuraea sp. NPDC049758]|uniref:glycosyltransferase n=1 Tax=Nonomuraea sp. NPDC049758 TaxID=3154360 RepID=UPI00343BC215